MVKMPKNMEKNIQHVFVDPSGKHVLLASSKQIIYLSNDHTSAKVVSEDDVGIFTSVDHEFFSVELVGCCPCYWMRRYTSAAWLGIRGLKGLRKAIVSLVP